MSDQTLTRAVSSPPSEASTILLGLPVDQWFDRKSARVDARGLAAVIVAFANAEGGTIAIGLRDGQIEDVGQQTALQNDWRQAGHDFVEPPARTSARLLPVVDADGSPAEILLLEADGSEIVHQTTSGDCYLRVGNESRKLGFRQRQELEFDKGQSQYDATALRSLTLDDLEPSALGRYRAAVGASGTDEQLLRARGLLSRGGEVTVGAFLMFGDAPQTVLPEAYVRVLRFLGTSRGTGADLELDEYGDVRIEGRIPEIIDRAAAEIRARAPRRRALDDTGRFAGTDLIPEAAWREGLVNAVVHRSYSLAGDHVRVEIYANRIEIESPGRFPGLARLDEPAQVSRFARNPHIARACADLRLGVELGEGVRRIYQQMRDSGLDDPRYLQSAGSVRLVLEATARLDPDTARALPTAALELLRALRRAGSPLSTGEAQERVAVSRPTVLRHLRALERAGLVRWVGQSDRDPRASWTLT